MQWQRSADRTEQWVSLINGIMWEVRSHQLSRVQVTCDLCECVCAHTVVLFFHSCYVFTCVVCLLQKNNQTNGHYETFFIKWSHRPSQTYTLLFLQEFPFTSPADNPHLTGIRWLDFNKKSRRGCWKVCPVSVNNFGCGAGWSGRMSGLNWRDKHVCCMVSVNHPAHFFWNSFALWHKSFWVLLSLSFFFF